MKTNHKLELVEAPTEEVWRARCLRFARALADIMANVPDNEIQLLASLSQVECANIAKARRDAENMRAVMNEN